MEIFIFWGYDNLLGHKLYGEQVYEIHNRGQLNGFVMEVTISCESQRVVNVALTRANEGNERNETFGSLSEEAINTLEEFESV